MVHKIKLILLGLIIFLLGLVAFNLKGNVETNILKTMLPQTVIDSSDIVPVTDKSASVVKVVFEADEENKVQALKSEFLKRVNPDDFVIKNFDFSGLIKMYASCPSSFLSYKMRELLKLKKYDKVYEYGISEIYNPAGIQFTTTDKDPYSLLNEFLLSNSRISEGVNYLDGKYYDSSALIIKSAQGLSPDLVNKKIAKLIKSQKELSKNGLKIYLAGSPIHSYYTSTRSVTDINLICILSTFMIIFLTYYYFKDWGLIIPISSGIIIGMLSGYIATRLWFSDFQIITMVFSTALIGIGIDYSYHYFFNQDRNKKFIKNLTFSLITTIVPFCLLYATEINLLKQVSVFTAFGLLGVYLTVVLFYGSFPLPEVKNFIQPNKKVCKIILCVILILGSIGYFRLKPNDTLTALYTPSKQLLKSEMLYNKVSGQNYQTTKIITVEGSGIQNILEKEEAITDQLSNQGIEYISLSKFIPSKSRQKENFELVKALYNSNLDRYSGILSNSQIIRLKHIKFSLDTSDDMKGLISEFMLKDNKSMILVFGDKSLDKIKGDFGVVNIQSDIGQYSKNYRESALKLLPVVVLSLFILIFALYGLKSALKILIPPIAASYCAVGLTSLITGEINLFSVIAVFLLLGFTMDYSIFRIGADGESENAVFASALTTSFSFLLLSFCGFKLLSSISLILFFGIVVSYLSGMFVFNNTKA